MSYAFLNALAEKTTTQQHHASCKVSHFKALNIHGAAVRNWTESLNIYIYLFGRLYK